MKLLACPINGPRPVSEFVCGGPVRPMPDPQACSDAQWADYVFNRDGAAGVKAEWWHHVPSGVWFIAERDTGRDVVLRTYLWGERPAEGRCGDDRPTDDPPGGAR